jgi:Leucine-rich repeat (LRR) protein
MHKKGNWSKIITVIKTITDMSIFLCIFLLVLSCGKEKNGDDTQLKDMSESILAEQMAIAKYILESVHGPTVNVPQHIKIENKRIVAFDIGHSETDTIPEGLGKLKDLKVLKINNTNIRHLPEDVFALTSVESLFVDVDKIDSLPESLENLKYLRYLSIYSNGLKKLPESIGMLMFLEELLVGVNSLERLPESICNLRSLRELAIYENHITHLPDSLGRLINLEHFEAQGNTIALLPPSFGQLKKLKVLYLNRNKFNSIPVLLDDLPLLKSLGIGGKIPFTEKMLPPKLFERNQQRDIELILG